MRTNTQKSIQVLMFVAAAAVIAASAVKAQNEKQRAVLVTAGSRIHLTSFTDKPYVPGKKKKAELSKLTVTYKLGPKGGNPFKAAEPNKKFKTITIDMLSGASTTPTVEYVYKNATIQKVEIEKKQGIGTVVIGYAGFESKGNQQSGGHPAGGGWNMNTN